MTAETERCPRCGLESECVDPFHFEAGENVTHLFRPSRRPMGIVLSVRLDGEVLHRLSARAESEDRTVSDLARQAINAFLPAALEAP